MALSLGHVRDLLNDIKILVAQLNRGTSPSSTTVEGLLTSINSNLVNIETVLTNDIATEATLNSVDGRLNQISGTIDDLLSIEQYAEWSSKIGNSIVLTYYTGVAAGNPSGNTSNIRIIEYKVGAGTEFTHTITYNASDFITSITTT